MVTTTCPSPQACIDGSMEVVSFLLTQGANVNQVDSEGWTPLHVAASCGNLEITEYVEHARSGDRKMTCLLRGVFIGLVCFFYLCC